MKRAFRGVLCAVLLGPGPIGAQGVATDQPRTRRFEVTASRYRFEPSRIEVTRGDVVELVLRSADTEHGLAIKAYKVKVKIPKGGEAVGVSFVASEVGTFPFSCSEFCGFGHRRMKGELVVAERAQ